MTHLIAFIAMITAFCLSSTLEPVAKPHYQWKMAAPPGSGCFPPACAPGKFPMAIVPITGFDGKLFNIGDRAVWTSTDGVNWDSQPKTEWGERYGMRFAFFANKLWMLGGMRTWDDFRNDVWSSLDGKDWKQVTTKAGWPSRRGHGVVVFNNKLWILGGSLSSGRRDETPSRFLNDVWSSDDGIKWTEVTEHAPWSAREVNVSLVFDNRIWVIGGGNNRDVWSSTNGKEWTLVTGEAEWGERGGNGGLVFDGKFWIFGGVDKNDVWSSPDGNNWQLVFANSPWSTRSSVYSAVFKDRLWIFSGKTGRTDSWSGDIWAMSKKTE